jgi:L-asparagine transporter-like permease
MIEKGFLKESRHGAERNGALPSMVTKVFFYLGLLAIIVALVMMLMNLDKADQYIWFWTPLVIAGIVMVIASRLMGNRPARRR